MHRLLHVLGETLASLRRDAAMVAAVVLVTFISLSFVGVAALLQTQADRMSDDVRDRPEVSVLLCTEDSAEAACPTGPISDEQRTALEQTLDGGAAGQYVDSYRQETRQQALENSRQSRDGGADPSPEAADMPESFRLLLADPQDRPAVTELFAGAPGVESIVDQQEILDQILAVLDGMASIALAAAVVMIVCAALLVAAAIRFSTFRRRRETDIMRLVGASRTMIRGPFVLEGVTAALIGSLLACAATWVIAEHVLGQWLDAQMPAAEFVDGSSAWLIMPGLVGLGVLLAVLSSWLTVRRRLQV